MSFSSFIRPFRRAALVIGIALALVGANASAALADIKIVQNASATGIEELVEKLTGRDVIVLDLTFVTYYKGDKFRQDSPNRNVAYIYDAAADKFYTMNHSDRTFSVRRLSDVLAPGLGGNASSASASISRSLSVEGKSTLTVGGSKRAIAGKTAKDYAVGAEIAVKATATGATLASIKAEGQHWTSDVLPLPSKNARLKRLAYFPGQLIIRNLMSPLGDRMVEMTGAPLNYDLILTISLNTPQGPDGGTFEVHSEVKSISTKPLPASLFKVPAGYRLVDQVREDRDGDID